MAKVGRPKKEITLTKKKEVRFSEEEFEKVNVYFMGKPFSFSQFVRKALKEENII